jgi:hypothetical protein
MPLKLKRKISKREANDMELTPFCTLIRPNQLKDWSIASDGTLNWVIIESTFRRDLDPTKEREIETHYKVITREKWWVEDANGEKVKYEEGEPNAGTNELGEVPLVTLYHKQMDEYIVGESILKDIVYINRAVLNWCSCVDEQIERQTFSQLVVPDDGTLAEASETGDDPLHKVGTSSIWTFNSTAGHPPQYISPNVENISVIWKITIDHIKEIFRLAGLVGTSDDMYSSRSGRAAQMGFLGVNSALADTSKGYQEFENKISILAYKQLDQDVSKYEKVEYPVTFDLTSLSEELNSYFDVLERNFSETLNKTIMKDISRKAVPLAPQTIRTTVESEIDAGDGIVTSPKNVMAESSQDEDAEKDGDGNKLNSDLGKTFRTKDQLDDKGRDRSEDGVK